MFDRGDDGPSRVCEKSIDNKKVKAFYLSSLVPPILLLIHIPPIPPVDAVSERGDGNS